MARPLKYTDTKQVQKIINDYFTDCDNRQAPYTLIGLANALDVNRITLYRYRDYKLIDNTDIQDVQTLTQETKLQLCNIISHAVDKIEQYTVEKLFDKDTYKGSQFLLACNYGYRNTQVLELQSDKDINITVAD